MVGNSFIYGLLIKLNVKIKILGKNGSSARNCNGITDASSKEVLK